MTALSQPITETEDLKALFGEWDYSGIIPVPSDDFWVFGYGSLIWNPGFPFAEAHNAIVHGYHRQFCVWSKVYRGTPEKPGLVMGLRNGGQVCGRAFRVLAADAAPTIEYLERRELRFEAYDVKWAKTKLADGREVKSLTFVMQKDSPSLATLGEAEIVDRLATCRGRAGPNRDYLNNLCSCLSAEGFPLGKLERLQHQVAEVVDENDSD